MGTSSPLIEKPPIILSLEIDRKLTLEMSTGFGGPNQSSVSVAIPVSVSDLTCLRDAIDSWINDLKTAKQCLECNVIYPHSMTTCPNCTWESHRPLE